MSVSVLLRLLRRPPGDADPHQPKRMAGQAEVVETGETVLFKDGNEMLAFLEKVADQAGREGGNDVVATAEGD